MKNDSQQINRESFSIIPLQNNDNDTEYWLSRPFEERIHAVEFLRQLMFGYDPATERLQRVFELLNSKQIEYLLIGGWAVGFYGYPKSTGDMDIWISNLKQNAAKMVEAFKEFGFNAPDLSIELFTKEKEYYLLNVLTTDRQLKLMMLKSILLVYWI